MNERMVLLISLGLYFSTSLVGSSNPASAAAAAGAGAGAGLSSGASSHTTIGQAVFAPVGSGHAAYGGAGEQAKAAAQESTEMQNGQIYSGWQTRKSFEPRTLAFSPNGKWLIAATQQYAKVIVFSVDETTGLLTPLQTIGGARNSLYTGIIDPFGSFYVNSLAYSPDSKWLVCNNRYGKGEVSLCAVDSEGKLTLKSTFCESFAETQIESSSKTMHFDSPFAVAYSPQGESVAIINDYKNVVMICKVDKQAGQLKLVQRISCPTQNKNGISENPHVMAYSSDGKWLAIARDSDKAITIFRVDENGLLTLVNNYKAKESPESVMFSPDGTLLCVISDKDFTIFAFDKANGSLTKVTWKVRLAAGMFAVGAFSPDGKWLAFIFGSNKKNIISYVYSVDGSTGSVKFVPGSSFEIGAGDSLSIAYSPDNLLLAVGHWGGLSMFEVDQETGALRSLTGGSLKKYSKVVQKFLKDEGHIPIPGILSIVDEYIVGPTGVKSNGSENTEKTIPKNK